MWGMSSAYFRRVQCHHAARSSYQWFTDCYAGRKGTREHQQPGVRLAVQAQHGQQQVAAALVSAIPELALPIWQRYWGTTHGCHIPWGQLLWAASQCKQKGGIWNAGRIKETSSLLNEKQLFYSYFECPTTIATVKLCRFWTRARNFINQSEKVLIWIISWQEGKHSNFMNTLC